VAVSLELRDRHLSTDGGTNGLHEPARVVAQPLARHHDEPPAVFFHPLTPDLVETSLFRVVVPLSVVLDRQLVFGEAQVQPAKELAVLVAACVLYHAGHFAWWKFAVLFLAPDLGMMGYALGKKIGAAVYNAAHTYVAVGLLWLFGYRLGIPSVLPLCLIWMAHIGFDRLLGYGLKYPSEFKDTHLGRV